MKYLDEIDQRVHMIMDLIELAILIKTVGKLTKKTKTKKSNRKKGD